MKFTQIALAVAAACGMHANAWGAPPSHNRVHATAYSYYDQDEAQASPSDAVPPAPAPQYQYAAPDANYGGSCGCQTACDCCEDSVCDPWRLFPEIGCGWTLTGFINASAVANADRPASHYNGPVTFHDQEDIRLNQLYSVLERKAYTGGCGTDWGARVDLLYGTDYIFTQAVGLELQDDGTNRWNRQSTNIPGAFAEYGLAMPQAYGEYAVNDLSLKLGHFYAPVGYQVVPANGNFFATQPYTFQYGEPFTMTGLLATWQYSDEWTFQGGAINGWDKFDAESDRIGFVGTFTYAPCHGAYTIFNSTVVGDEDGTVPPYQGTRFLNSLVFTYNVSDNVQYVFQNDIGKQDNGVAPGVDAEWYGINQYLYYTVNDCWKLGVRGEWFRDDDGTRLAAAPIRAGGAANAAGLLGVPLTVPGDLAGNYYNLAVGANWTPSSNLIIRPEMRWDWSDGTVVRPYDDFTKDSQFIAAIDAILLY